MIQAASTSIHGAHGQYVENVHIQQYKSIEHFWDVLYPKYLNLIRRARDFLDNTGGPGDDIIILIRFVRIELRLLLVNSWPD